MPDHNNWPAYQASPFQQWLSPSMTPQWAQEPVSFFPTSPAAIDLSLTTYCSALPSTSSSVAHGKWPQACPETLFLPDVGANTTEAMPLAKPADIVSPRELEDNDFPVNLFSRPYQDPVFFLNGLHGQSLLHSVWANSDSHDIGRDELFAVSHQGALSYATLVSGLDTDYGQSLNSHRFSPPQQLELNIENKSPILDDMDTVAQPLLYNVVSDPTSSSGQLGQRESCLNETHSHQDHINRDDGLVLRPRQNTPKPQPRGAGVGQDTLVVSEDSQDVAEECTCDTQPADAVCPSCASSSKPWVMVTYKLGQPPTREKKKPAPRKRLEEDARRQTSETRGVGACIRCKIQRVRVRADPTRLEAGAG